MTKCLTNPCDTSYWLGLARCGLLISISCHGCRHRRPFNDRGHSTIKQLKLSSRSRPFIKSDKFVVLKPLSLKPSVIQYLQESIKAARQKKITKHWSYKGEWSIGQPLWSAWLKMYYFLPFLGAKTLHSFIVKNTKNWYKIFLLGAIFVILPILLQFFYDTNISKYLITSLIIWTLLTLLVMLTFLAMLTLLAIWTLSLLRQSETIPSSKWSNLKNVT